MIQKHKTIIYTYRLTPQCLSGTGPKIPFYWLQISQGHGHSVLVCQKLLHLYIIKAYPPKYHKSHVHSHKTQDHVNSVYILVLYLEDRARKKNLPEFRLHTMGFFRVIFILWGSEEGKGLCLYCGVCWLLLKVLNANMIKFIAGRGKRGRFPGNTRCLQS